MSNGARARRQSALLLASLGSEDPAVAREIGKILEAQAYAAACQLPAGWQVLHALRHGEPSIQQSIAKIDRGVEELVVLPMYPQFSPSTSGTILREVYRVAGELREPRDLATRTAWYNDGGYVNAQARLIASFTSSLELNPSNAQLLLCAQQVEDVGEGAHGAYEAQVDHTASLVLERLGWPVTRASVVYDSRAALESRLNALAGSPEKNIVLIPMTLTSLSRETPEQLAGHCPGAQLFVGPALDTYGPFITAVKNLAVRGPRSVALGMEGTAPLLAPKSSSEEVDLAPGSLVMIGASVAGKVRSQHGPDVVHSPSGVFCEVKKTRKELRAFLDWVREETPVEEAFVWSTCQRIEFYGWHSEAEGVADHEWPVAEIRQHLYGAEPEGLKVNVLFGAEGWHHLMRTACGLNSALPGDTDVVSQLQTSCRMGERVGTAGAKATGLVDSAVTLAEEVREKTSWGKFSRGFCAAALSRVHDLSGADLERCKHVVIGGSATSRSVLFTLADRFKVSRQQMTLVYRDHHGQMKLLRNAIGNGTRLRVHSYSERDVIETIADADFVFFGIDHSEPVISAEMLDGVRDFGGRPLVVVDFNDSGSVDELETIDGISVWTSDDLDRAVESYADVMCADKQFAQAVEQAESWIEARLPGGENE